MDHLKAENEEEEKLLPRPVKVRMFKLAWMQREGKNFIVLTPSLGENSDDFYKSQFMNGMLTHFWPDIQEKIFWRQFLPFVMYMLTSVLFMYYALRPNPESVDPMAIGPFEIGMAVLTLLCLLYAVRNEFLQFSRMEDKLSYFTSFWNYIDIVGIAFTLIIIISAFSGEGGLISYEVLRILAAFASCCQMVKCYDWLRLFESTSFYILLITETLNDIKPFMILLAVTLLTFGIPMVLLNLNRSEDNAIIDPVFGFWLLDLVMNQYLLALGEFNMDAFSDNPQSALCYIFFILATFITQLTMLNMLIAIMGDTFGRVMENAEVNGTKTKLDLMSDLASIIGTNKSVASNEGDYLFMVTPDDDEGDHGDSWEGAINKMNNLNEKRHEELQELVKSQAGKLVDLAQADIKREVTQNAELRRVIYDMIQHTVAQSESNIRSEIDELKEMIRSIKN